MAYAIPTAEERPILFRWLKQQSSYTIWRQIGPYYEAWADEVKRVQPIAIDPKEGGLAMHESKVRIIQLCWAAFGDALAKLKTGDRSTFKWLGFGTGQGYFCEALRAVRAWQTSEYRNEDWNPRFALVDTPYWPEVSSRFNALNDVISNGGAALEHRNTDVPALISDMQDLRGVYGAGFPGFRALRDADLTLPPVRAPAEAIIVKTGESVPCYGIWEPVKLGMTPGFIGLFKRPLLPPDGRFELDGCMNYLHAGSPAPTIAFEEDDIRSEAVRPYGACCGVTTGMSMGPFQMRRRNICLSDLTIVPRPPLARPHRAMR